MRMLRRLVRWIDAVLLRVGVVPDEAYMVDFEPRQLLTRHEAYAFRWQEYDGFSAEDC
jgi:hypothetical protein